MSIIGKKSLSRALLAMLALAVGLSGKPAVAAGQEPPQELIVSAAASLTNAFREIGAAFEKDHPNTKVIFNFAASGALLQQIEQGAPVDVFASADQDTLDQGQSKKLIDSASRADFASNRLVLIVPGDTALALQGPRDLAQEAVKRIAVGNPASVPVGRYTRAALGAELWDSLLPKFIYADNVRQVLDYVSRAEVDAGFVFVTDAAVARGKVKAITELATQKPVRYPIAVVAAGKQPRLAGEFIQFVLGEGQSILAGYGFGKP